MLDSIKPLKGETYDGFLQIKPKAYSYVTINQPQDLKEVSTLAYDFAEKTILLNHYKIVTTFDVLSNIGGLGNSLIFIIGLFALPCIYKSYKK